MNNPYESPTVEAVLVEPKPYHQSLHTLAKGSWITPFACMGVSIFLNSQSDTALGIAGGFFFLGGILLGLIFAVLGLAFSWKYQRLFWHSLAGLLVSVIFIGMVIAMLMALASVREMNALQN
jgi:hypothetical protein